MSERQHYGNPRTHKTWIYFIQGMNGGPIKIGKTRSKVTDRLQVIQTSNPEKLKILSACQFDVVPDIEPGIHAALSEYRLHGEWFLPKQRVLDYALLAKAGMEDAIRALVEESLK